MGRIKRVLLLLIAFIVVFGGVSVWHALAVSFAAPAWGKIFVVSQDFTDQSVMSSQFTCQGQNVNPEISYGNLPGGTVSVAIDMVDTNSLASGYAHWIIWGIAPGIGTIPQNLNQQYAYRGLNDYGHKGYDGPCPSFGNHHYKFEVYALDFMPNLPSGTSYAKFKSAIKNHVIGYGSLVGEYHRQ